ncbi:hypothetical protein Tco_0845478 [Tanacetum coccineum]
MGGSYYPIPCSILSTGKDRKTPKRYPDVPTTSWRIFIQSMDSFQGLTLKKDLALYDNESWNNLRDFAKLVKAIALPQDVPMVPTTLSIAWKTPNKPLSTTHSRVQTKWKARGLLRTMDQEISMMPPTPGRRNQTSTGHIPKPSLTRKANRSPSTPLQDDMIEKVNLLWKIVFEKLNDTSPPENAGNAMAPKSIAVISHDEKEELGKKGIKSPSKLLSLKYLSPASIKELNKNPSSPKRVHFVNSIVILSTDSDTEEEDISSTNACNLDLDGMVKGKEGVKEQGKEENEMGTGIEVDEVIEEEDSEFETDEEVKEIIKDEEDDSDGENFNVEELQVFSLGNAMAPKSIAVISHDEEEELRKKGIKIPSKLLSPKYLSPASIKEVNKSPSSPKLVHFVNSIIILSTDSDMEEENVSSTNSCNLDLGGMVKGKEGVKEQGKEENEMGTGIEVDEVIKEEDSEFETDEEVKEILEDEEDGENFNIFPTMKELTHHKWLLKNPRPPWVKARIRAESPNNIKISCMVGHIFKKHAYIDLESPINIMSRRQ